MILIVSAALGIDDRIDAPLDLTHSLAPRLAVQFAARIEVDDGLVEKHPRRIGERHAVLGEIAGRLDVVPVERPRDHRGQASRLYARRLRTFRRIASRRGFSGVGERRPVAYFPNVTLTTTITQPLPAVGMR